MLFIAVTAVAIVSCSVTILYCTRALCVLVHARIKLINLNWAECSKSCPAGKSSVVFSVLFNFSYVRNQKAVCTRWSARLACLDIISKLHLPCNVLLRESFVLFDQCLEFINLGSCHLSHLHMTSHVDAQNFQFAQCCLDCMLTQQPSTWSVLATAMQ